MAPPRIKTLFISLVLSGALSVSAADEYRRKSLSFGPIIPSTFISTPPPLTSFSTSSDTNPFELAQKYLDEVILGCDDETSNFIRPDSYTDSLTGISHVYVRQVVNGLEVADANININIQGGKVLSYGDSFYRGPLPDHKNDEAMDHHSTYCSLLQSYFTPSERGPQLILDNNHPYDSSLISHLLSSNCPSSTFSETDLLGDPVNAALHFMSIASPKTYTLTPDQIAGITMSSSSSFQDTQTLHYIHDVPGTVNPIKTQIVYVQSPSTGSLELAWKLEVEMEDNWYEAYVAANSIHSVIDWASDAPASHIRPVPKEPKFPEASYKVFAWGLNDPEEAEGKTEIVKAPHDKMASPWGWHAMPAANDPMSPEFNKPDSDPEEVSHSDTAWGNNVFAHENWEGQNSWQYNYRPVAEDLSFDFPYDPEKNGTRPRDYINFTVTQLFYTSNMVHDLTYRYGFDEVAGNFQQHNFGKGGKENDAVIANAQDGSGYNNANFMTPPDGQNPRCRMYIWNTATPYRDGDLEAGIVIHELAHGLSTRLTGGPANSGCLAWGESGGMGEGWGDFLATTIRSTEVHKDYAMGAWAANTPKGIRNFIYSTNMTTNPSTYKILDKPGYWGVHAIGEVWAEILWVTSQILIQKHGYSNTLFPPQPLEDGSIPFGDFYREGKKGTKIPIHGNTLMVQLVITAMKLQPCRPSFFDARDAILQADVALTGGENQCELWKGFSGRGLGSDATLKGSTPWGGGVRTDGVKKPKGVCKDEHDEPEPEEPEPEEPEPEDPKEPGFPWFLWA